MRLRYLILLAAVLHIGWYGPRFNTGLTASQDVLANSTDTHSVGLSSNYWRTTYSAYDYKSEHADVPSTVSSFGVVWVSTDNLLYYTNSSGTSYTVDVTEV